VIQFSGQLFFNVCNQFNSNMLGKMFRSFQEFAVYLTEIHSQ